MHVPDFLPSQELSVDAIVTPPAGTGTGTATLAVTTTTPEIGVYPNTASIDIRYRPLAGSPTLFVEPATDLENGDVVSFDGDGFRADAEIIYCEAVVIGDRSPCGTPIRSTSTDDDGTFHEVVGLARFLVVLDVGVVDCAQPQAMCVLWAVQVVDGEPPVLAPLSFAPQPPVTDPFGARISGTVTDATGHPVAGAPVWAFRPSDTWVGSCGR